jgi:hypothetical protein
MAGKKKVAWKIDRVKGKSPEKDFERLKSGISMQVPGHIVIIIKNNDSVTGTCPSNTFDMK